MSQPFLLAMSSTVSWPSDDAHRPGNRLGSDGVVASHHDDLDSSRPALGHGVRHGSPGRIDHGHQADEAEAVEGEVLLVRVEGVADGVLVGRQGEVAEAEDTFTGTAELHVGRLEVVLPLLSQGKVLAVDADGGAPLEDPLRGALHHHHVALVVGVARLVDGDLELVGRVEGDLANLLVGRPVRHHVALAQLGALKDSRLGGIAVDLPLEDADPLLAALELGPVAQTGHPLQGLPAGCVLVKAGAGLVLRGVGVHDFVVEPHVGDGHPVLGEGAGLVRADAGGGTQGLHGLQVLDKAVLGSHPLGCQSETDSDGSKEA